MDIDILFANNHSLLVSQRQNSNFLYYTEHDRDFSKYENGGLATFQTVVCTDGNVSVAKSIVTNDSYVIGNYTLFSQDYDLVKRYKHEEMDDLLSIIRNKILKHIPIEEETKRKSMINQIIGIIVASEYGIGTETVTNCCRPVTFTTGSAISFVYDGFFRIPNINAVSNTESLRVSKPDDIKKCIARTISTQAINRCAIDVLNDPYINKSVPISRLFGAKQRPAPSMPIRYPIIYIPAPFAISDKRSYSLSDVIYGKIGTPLNNDPTSINTMSYLKVTCDYFSDILIYIVLQHTPVFSLLKHNKNPLLPLLILNQVKKSFTDIYNDSKVNEDINKQMLECVAKAIAENKNVNFKHGFHVAFKNKLEDALGVHANKGFKLQANYPDSISSIISNILLVVGGKLFGSRLSKVVSDRLNDIPFTDENAKIEEIAKMCHDILKGDSMKGILYTVMSILISSIIPHLGVNVIGYDAPLSKISFNTSGTIRHRIPSSDIRIDTKSNTGSIIRNGTLTIEKKSYDGLLSSTGDNCIISIQRDTKNLTPLHFLISMTDTGIVSDQRFLYWTNDIDELQHESIFNLDRWVRSVSSIYVGNRAGDTFGINTGNTITNLHAHTGHETRYSPNSTVTTRLPTVSHHNKNELDTAISIFCTETGIKRENIKTAANNAFFYLDQLDDIYLYVRSIPYEMKYLVIIPLILTSSDSIFNAHLFAHNNSYYNGFERARVYTDNDSKKRYIPTTTANILFTEPNQNTGHSIIQIQEYTKENHSIISLLHSSFV